MYKFQGMTVGDIRKLIADLPDDMPLLIPGSDHSYYQATIKRTIAVYDEQWGWFEDYGDLNPEEITEESRKPVLVADLGLIGKVS